MTKIEVTSCDNCPFVVYYCKQGFNGNECKFLPYTYDIDKIPNKCPLKKIQCLQKSKVISLLHSFFLAPLNWGALFTTIWMLNIQKVATAVYTILT